MPIDRVVVNASPLICLFQAGMEGILGLLWSHVEVPEAVWEEILAGPKTDRAAKLLASASWAKKVEANTILPQIAAWDLGPGESEVLTFAFRNPGYRAVIDDAEARRCARTFGIPLLGTGGILVLAKRRGLVGSVSQALDTLKESGLWLSDDIVRMLRSQAGE